MSAHLSPASNPEVLADARAQAWRFAFDCLREKRREKAAGRLPSSDGRDDTKGLSNDRTANRQYTGDGPPARR